MKKFCIIFFTLLLIWFPAGARDVSFPNLSGGEISYEEIKMMPKAILFVWTTWCPHCREELDKLRKKSIFFENISIFYVNAGEAMNKVEKYADYKDFAGTTRERTILDSNSYLVRRFSVSAVPTYIFLKNGEIVGKTYFLTEKLIEKIYGVD
ncbi:MAG: redoxin domain-containing protein [Candidatus Omnitrophica bacterium]|nr:redoxin domain-containing protein [Candidatus Omnitrophota bacterium]MBD3269841.1 redoxin domain-containing protein [Candidatus Omnitrophota bacterium]